MINIDIARPYLTYICWSNNMNTYTLSIDKGFLFQKNQMVVMYESDLGHGDLCVYQTKRTHGSYLLPTVFPRCLKHTFLHSKHNSNYT